MEWVDIIIIAIISISGVLGFFKGFIREVLFVVAAIVGGVLAFNFAILPEYWVPYREWGLSGLNITSHDLSYVISFILIILSTLLLGQMLASALTYFYDSKNAERGFLGWNRLFGLLFGLLRGALIVVVLTSLAGLTPLTDKLQWTEAKIAPIFEDISGKLIQQLPSEYSRHFSFSADPGIE